MSHARVLFDHVSMKFHRGETHDSLRDLIPAMVKRLVGKGPDPKELAKGDFWALNDLSFEVKPGEVLGIIGANGSGKSTTLRILTKILEPTRGRMLVTGRIGALIEISAGFHGDLTGRENVFLQGAIMGMRSKDIARKFDEIVEFSGISAFIDTPVKRYSSGMNARLGFSIAAHLDPDVLIIDEVLAVGDFLFQEKAFGRISQLGKSGIPIVLVSHQLDRVSELCTHGILLERGNVVCRGTTSDCIAAYVQQRTPSDDSAPNTVADAAADAPVRLVSLDLVGGDQVASGEWFKARIRGVIDPEMHETVEPVLVRVRSLLSGRVLFATGARKLGANLSAGPFTLDVSLQANVPAGSYLVEACGYDSAAQREIAWTPTATLRVTDSTVFVGSVQLNPQVEVQPA